MKSYNKLKSLIIIPTFLLFVSCGQRILDLNIAELTKEESTFATTWVVGDPSYGDGDNSITLPLRSGYNYDFEVDWGDGTTSEISSFDDPEATHNYVSAGTYVVTMKGLAEAWHFNCSGDYEKFRGDVQLGDLGWRNLEDAFTCVVDVNLTASGVFGNLINTTSMFSSMEDSLINLQDFEAPILGSTEKMFEWIYYVDVNLKNVSTPALLTAHQMFLEGYRFNLIVEGWDAGSLAVASEMFNTVWNSTAHFEEWKTSKLVDMTKFFYWSGDFDVTGTIDVSNVENMSQMFVKSGPISVETASWDLSSLTDMSYMLSEAYQLDIDTSNWNTSSVTDMSYLFFDSYSLNLNTSNWNTSNVVDISYLMNEANDIFVDVSSWDTSSVENMSFAFANTNFSGGVAANWNFSSVIAMDSMYAGETLTTVDYDALLNRIDTTATQPNVNFDAGLSQYTGLSSAETSRTNLQSNGWVISDGGVAP